MAEQIILTTEQREHQIKKILKTLAACMDECDSAKIKWSDMTEVTEHMWALKHNKESWSCGSIENKETLEQMMGC